MGKHGALRGMNGDERLRPPEYTCWKNMRWRCANPKSKDYKYYGARGIRVCDRWQDSYANFIADMGPRPSPKHTLERKDNDGHYEPSNCIWATQREQATNKRHAKSKIQYPYWMRREYGGGEYFILVFPKTTPRSWFADATSEGAVAP